MNSKNLISFYLEEYVNIDLNIQVKSLANAYKIIFIIQDI